MVWLPLLLCLSLSSAALVQREFLYMWGGGTYGDAIATIDFTVGSPTYGKVLDYAPLVASDRVNARGNEAHHVGLTNNGRWIAGGGLTSFFFGKDEIFVYEVDNKTKIPRFSYSLDAPGACADDFAPIGDEEFIVSMMCNTDGRAPGTLVKLNCRTREVTEWLVKPPGWETSPEAAGFNPHGVSFNKDLGVLTTDYLQPVSLFNSPPKVQFRDTVRHITTAGVMNSTILQPGSFNDGMMGVRWLPRDTKKRAITSGTSGNGLYLVWPFGDPDSTDPARQGAFSEKVYDLATMVNGITGLSSGVAQFTGDGKRMIMTFSMRYVTLMDISDVMAPVFLDIFDFCDPPLLSGAPDFSAECDATNNNVGTHFSTIWGDRVVVVNYYLILGNFNFGGTGTVHVFRLVNNRTKLEYDPTFTYRLEKMEYPHAGRIGNFTVEEDDLPPYEPPESGVSIVTASVFSLALLFASMLSW